VDFFAAVVTLLLVMDPLGNIPLFLSVLKVVRPERRRRVLVREILLAYVILLACLVAAGPVLRLLRLQQESISMAGGIVLFIIALRMIFPGAGEPTAEHVDEEPFLVPLAVPLIAGPSALATLLLLQRSAPGHLIGVVAALTIAWAASGAILLSSTFFYRVLRERGLIAMERLMGMLLVMVAVQMFMNGVEVVLHR
jgi:multiple antibiotic resistance protein